MKISATQYANALYELTEGEEKARIDAVAKKFTQLLIKNRQNKLVGKIIEKFNEIYNRKNGIIEAEVTTREKVSTEVYTQVRTYVSTKYKAKEVVLINKIDENIKGGIVIKVGDEILDGSVIGRLNSLKNILTK